MGDVSGLAYLVLAHVLLQKRDFEGALEAASTATDVRPSCDVAFGIAASVMRYLGRWEEAIELAGRAMRLSPLLADWYQCVIANAYFVGRDYRMAASTAEGVISEREDHVDALLTLAASQAALGFERHASATLDHARSKRPSLRAAALREDLPYRDESTLERFIEKLEEAGLE
jgi:tetratricopeptide (TPR) repeat protein